MNKKAEDLYPYTVGDRLTNNRNTYFYTKYYGKETFKAWREIRSLESTEEKIKGLELLFFVPKESLFFFSKMLLQGNIIETDKLLDAVFYSLQTKDNSDDLSFWLKKLTKKFEVCKRIHSKYTGERFLAVDKLDHRELNLYFKLASVLTIAYEQTELLPYLNTFIKIMDSLNSQSVDFSKNEKQFFLFLANKERLFVEKIAERFGVSI